MSLLHLVEQDHPVGTTAYCLGQLSPFLVSNVSWRSPDQARHGVLLHVLRHIQPYHGLFVVEQELGQGTCQLGLAHPGRSEEDEAADGSLGVLEPGPASLYRLGDSGHRLLLVDYPLVNPLLHVNQLVRLRLHHSGDGYARPLGDQRGDVLLVHHAVEFLVFLPLRPGLVVSLLQAHSLRLQFRSFLVVLTLGGSLLLVGKTLHLPVQVLDLRWSALHIDAQLACCLIDQVNGLVRQEPVRNIPLAQLGCRYERRVLDGYLVVGLISCT